MTYTRVFEAWGKLASRAIKSSRFVTFAMVAIFVSLAMQPVQAQSADTWKSVAIIGGSTAAGAYIGHKVAGPTGTWIGAGLGASAGYVIDRHRRENEYYNNQYAYGDGGYYPNSGAYPGNGGYSGNGGYYGGPYNGGAYRSGYLTSSYHGNADRCSRR